MFKNIESEIERIISKSEIPEDSEHSKNTRAWILRLKPEADMALQIAGLGHDIERSIKELKINRENYTCYDDFKMAHARNSAKVLRELLAQYDLVKIIRDKVVNLVTHHEFGGSPEANILKEADSISYFDVNVQFYFQRNSKSETAFRIMWGYQRLSDEGKAIVRDFSYDDIELETLIRDVVSEVAGKPV
ncbi:MAG: DUF4202 family protein [Bacteroidetes bacterium]|nr:DUF4202 family protein [Bacteroidota bacterium]